MKVLIIGSGGREHALAVALKKSKRVSQIFVAPGNAGTAKIAENVPIPAKNIELLLKFVQEHAVNLTIVGPELPLTLGIVDEFQRAGHKIFGPSKKASAVEGSKIFTKEFCRQFDIPTAPFTTFSSAHDAKEFLKTKNCYPIVIKADGLAAGKGVVIAQNEDEGIQTIQDMMVYEKFGEAGRQILIEDYISGEEASFIVVTDSKDYRAFPAAQDHKRVFNNDQGPNTGGMGAYAPAPVVTAALEKKICQKIIEPTLKGLAESGRPYVGFLYAGVMICGGEPYLIEYNARLGDPEAEVLLPLLKSDLVDFLEHALNGTLANAPVEFYKESCVGVVLTSGGYPGDFQEGFAISGLDEKFGDQVTVLHAGTKSVSGKILTNGGRVLVVTGKGPNLAQAIQTAYTAVQKISFEKIQFRTDIGAKGILKIKQDSQ